MAKTGYHLNLLLPGLVTHVRSQLLSPWPGAMLPGLPCHDKLEQAVTMSQDESLVPYVVSVGHFVTATR